jgi:serine/threonine protein kinase
VAKVLSGWSDNMLKNEVEVSRQIKSMNGFAKYFDHGRVDIEGSGKWFIIFEKLGNSILDEIDSYPDKLLSLRRIMSIGLQILDRLEDLHSLGYVHCDLKPENFLLDIYRDRNHESAHGYQQVYLIDMGSARLYANDDGHHIEDVVANHRVN